MIVGGDSFFSTSQVCLGQDIYSASPKELVLIMGFAGRSCTALLGNGYNVSSDGIQREWSVNTEVVDCQSPSFGRRPWLIYYS